MTLDELIARFDLGNPDNLFQFDAQEFRDIRTKLVKVRAGLIRIACYDDVGACAKLAHTGSYSSFDEPNSVQTAREILEDES